MKYCKNCGTENNDNSVTCVNCGITLETATTETKQKKTNFKSIFLFVIHLILAVAVLIIFVLAADKIKQGGLEIMSIQSVGGKTLEEAYYQNLGYIYEGYYMITIALGIFCASVLTSLGIKRLKK